jgi:hypothetical protein
VGRKEQCNNVSYILYAYLEAWDWTPLNTLLIGLLDSDTDVGDVDDMFSLLK